MAIPTEITFHELDSSASVEAAIERWVSRLEHVCDRMIHVHATLSTPHRHHRKHEFEVHLKLDIAGTGIFTRFAKHEDVYVAIADAFRAARRALLADTEVKRAHRGPFVQRYASVS